MAPDTNLLVRAEGYGDGVRVSATRVLLAQLADADLLVQLRVERVEHETVVAPGPVIAGVIRRRSSADWPRMRSRRCDLPSASLLC